MRRIRIILASLALATTVTTFGPGVPHASAHFCANPVELAVAKRAIINIGVAAEDKPVIGVDVTVPKYFDLVEPVGFLGWEGTVDGDVVHFQGAVIQPYTCAYFGFDGEATKKGRLVAPIVTHTEDGTATDYKSTQPFNPYAGAADLRRHSDSGSRRNSRRRRVVEPTRDRARRGVGCGWARRRRGGVREPPTECGRLTSGRVRLID